jgi:hypothetical protein
MALSSNNTIDTHAQMINLSYTLNKLLKIKKENRIQDKWPAIYFTQHMDFQLQNFYLTFNSIFKFC